jgi:hypothetical protein
MDLTVTPHDPNPETRTAQRLAQPRVSFARQVHNMLAAFGCRNQSRHRQSRVIDTIISGWQRHKAGLTASNIQKL